MYLLLQVHQFDPEAAKLMPALYLIAVLVVILFSAFTAIVLKLTRDNKEAREAFLAHIERSEIRAIESETERQNDYRELGDACHLWQREQAADSKAVLKDSATALHHNAAALGANARTQERMANLLEHLARRLPEVT